MCTMASLIACASVSTSATRGIATVMRSPPNSRSRGRQTRPSMRARPRSIHPRIRVLECCGRSFASPASSRAPASAAGTSTTVVSFSSVIGLRWNSGPATCQRQADPLGYNSRHYKPRTTRPVITRIPARWLAATVLCAALAGVAGCHRGMSKEDAQMSNPEQIYQRARKELNSSNYELAIRLYEALEARYPFSESARQARLDLMYAYYLKGLVYFEAVPNFMERFFRVDLTERPPVDGLKSFTAFQTLVQQYPHSIYAHDAERRMVYLRNRLANYEIEVARYYMKRGAYVAALNRAQYTIEHYDGSPAVPEALKIMISAYRKMDLPDLAEKTQAVYQANYPEGEGGAGKEKKSWWHFWG